MRTASHIGAIEVGGPSGAWLRTEFRRINGELDELAFAAGTDVAPPSRRARELSTALVRDGATVLGGELEGSAPSSEREAYGQLGRLGLWLAALRRHGLDGPDAAASLQAVWERCEQLGDALGVAPRYVFAHQSTHADVVTGDLPTFTTAAHEAAFVVHNVTGVRALRRAARSAADAEHLPIGGSQLGDALAAIAGDLGEVLAGSQALARDVPVDRFFASVRPYFRPHRVGEATWRGVNAGDFSAVNELDLRLGLAPADDLEYRSVLAEKRLHLPPGDGDALDAALGSGPSLAQRLLDASPTRQVRANAAALLAARRAHGAAASFHHHRLVRGYLERPALKLGGDDDVPDVTASGPPLSDVVAGLARLLALRTSRTAAGRARRDALRRLASSDQPRPTARRALDA